MAVIVNATYRGQTIVEWPQSPATSTRPTYRAGSFYPVPKYKKSRLAHAQGGDFLQSGNRSVIDRSV
ncbi:hypothetical protein LF95_12035 [Thalassospira sp. TSL5-1]|nr:hypothetical protein LF95_12035 [Thalassospira sp. TSL5-1]